LTGCWAGLSCASASALLDARTDEPPLPEETAERRIGDYQLIRELGRGGMGVVYLARQISLDRLVALKVLSFASALDSRQIERFRIEARAAALIQHPNIASVYAVGYESGIHFYAMQYVDGRALDRFVPDERPASWLDDSGVPTASASSAAVEPVLPQQSPRSSAVTGTRHEYAVAPEWLASPGTPDHVRQVALVGVQVAEALQQAHEYGVIHRDIKPSNLLLDRHGKVWITDFGLARVQTDARVTQTGDIVGTLRYMSPEQSLGMDRILNERTDVYSLGVTLYELAGQQAAFSGIDRNEILRRIALEDPIPLRRINPLIPIDLETIIMKAMAKTPEQRYASARDFATDLKNYLQGRPITARRAGWAERWAKWARRHKAVVRAALAATFATLIVLALTTFLVLASNRRLAAAHEEIHQANLRLRQALNDSEESRRQAKESLERARTHFQQARQVVDLFGTRYAEALQSLPGAESLRYRVLRDTLEYYQRFVDHADDDPQFKRDMAVTHTKMAGMHKRLGDVAEALNDYGRARALLEALVREQPDAVSRQADLATCDSNIGLLLGERGQVAEARQAYQRAIARQQSLVRVYPAEAKHRADLAVTTNNLALLESQSGHETTARKLFEDAARLEEGLVAADANNVEYLARRAVSLSNRSQLAAARAPATAAALCVEAIEIQQRLLALQPTATEHRYELALSYQNLGALQLATRDFAGAEAACEKAISLLDNLSAATPSVVKYRFQAAVCRNNLGQILMRLDRAAEASQRFRRAAETLKELTTAHADNPTFQNGLGGVFNNLAGALRKRNDLAGAEEAYRTAIGHQRRAVELAPGVPRYRSFLAAEYQNYAELLHDRGNTAAAEKMKHAARNIVVRPTDAQAAARPRQPSTEEIAP
jgi:serine/threonine protein kinase/tetratricopeptide (TPR) repeat protein